jgi:hypothetical protein
LYIIQDFEEKIGKKEEREKNPGGSTHTYIDDTQRSAAQQPRPYIKTKMGPMPPDHLQRALRRVPL